MDSRLIFLRYDRGLMEGRRRKGDRTGGTVRGQ
jgi:hypothetical protein